MTQNISQGEIFDGIILPDDEGILNQCVCGTNKLKMQRNTQEMK
jgi:hypothetical protein